MKHDDPAERGVSIDLYERMPAPFGLIRYGVAPDHPRIKGIINAPHKVLDKPQIRLLGNIDYGTDITLADLKSHYDAVIFSTGATDDRGLNIPGVDLERSHGAAQFVAWYDGHPGFPRTWPLEERRSPSSASATWRSTWRACSPRPATNCSRRKSRPTCTRASRPTRRSRSTCSAAAAGAGQFTPLELKELDHSPTSRSSSTPRDIEYDEGSAVARRSSKITDQVATIIENYAIREPKQGPSTSCSCTSSRTPSKSSARTAGRGLRTERTELDGTGNVQPTGRTNDWDVTAIYRAVGYLSDNLPQIPFDHAAGVIPNEAGRIFDDGAHLAGSTPRAGSSAAPSA